MILTALNFLKLGLPAHSGRVVQSVRADCGGLALPPRSMSISTTTIKLPLIPTSPKSSIASHGATSTSGARAAAVAVSVVVPGPVPSSFCFGLAIRSRLNSRSKSSSSFLPRLVELTALRKSSSVSSLWVADDDGGFGACFVPPVTVVVPVPVPCVCVCVVDLG